MLINSKVNIEESILWKKRVIDFDITKDSMITLSQKAQFLWKIVQTAWKTEVQIWGIVFDGDKLWKDVTIEIIKNCAKNDARNFKVFGIEK